MIASVRGTVVARRPDAVVVECGGVGYRLAVSAHTLQKVAPVGEKAFLHSHLIMRDDAMQLYGFATEDERDLFLLLLGVQGVGPKVALAVLSGGTTGELLNAIAAGDAKRFQAVPGIGKRTAERVIVELREKVGERGEGEGILVSRADDPRTFAREALLGLGFTLQEAERLLAGAAGESAEELIEGALRARAAAA
ncbi:MAG: holliday junction helicase RuvA [Thermoleophilaceae bacterium]|jgi:Holliday junction DNA helicase RuvA|nr:holliday junction helicase RuvA [Thermoleophilaceae bacterium]